MSDQERQLRVADRNKLANSSELEKLKCSQREMQNLRVDRGAHMVPYRQLNDRRGCQRETREHRGSIFGAALRVLHNFEMVGSIAHIQCQK